MSLKIIFCLIFCTFFYSLSAQKKTLEVQYKLSSEGTSTKTFSTNVNIQLIFNDSLYRYQNIVNESTSSWQYKIIGFRENVLDPYTIGNIYENTQYSMRKSCKTGKKSIIVDNLPIIKWEIIDAEKVILGLKCKKAIGNYRGRAIIAFYTTEISTPIGPYKIVGLPGLILEAKSTDGTFIYKAESINTLIDYNVSNFDVPFNKMKIFDLENQIKCVEKDSKQRLKVVESRMKTKIKEYNKSNDNNGFVSSEVVTQNHTHSLELIYEWELKNEKK
ncbi:GLPGLI family protein [Nonlabens sp.]|uniref:GLPGLI family protein n=1 Tax=Nonlabens sp. TaxID=1888209 RepID=UPI003F6A42AD